MKMVDDDKGAHQVKTVGGCTWTAKYSGGKVTDRRREWRRGERHHRRCRPVNGVIHVIDEVLLPKM